MPFSHLITLISNAHISVLALAARASVHALSAYNLATRGNGHLSVSHPDLQPAFCHGQKSCR